MNLLVQAAVTQPSMVIMLAAAAGLVVNTLTVIIIGLKGGHAFGRLEGAVSNLTKEIERLRDWRHELGNIDQRVIGLESEQQELTRELQHIRDDVTRIKAEVDIRARGQEG